jgi:Glycosyltransferase family 87
VKDDLSGGTSGLTALARRQRLLPWYVGTRLLMLAFATNLVPYFNKGAITGDVQLYQRWVQDYFMADGKFPDVGSDALKWQYPPGAAGPIMLPKLFSNEVIPGSYFVFFYLMCFVADVVVFRMLLKAARTANGAASPSLSLAGPWTWTLGIPAIGPMVYGRYDLVVTAFAVGALTVALRSEPATARARGVLIGIGTMIKVWPAALLFGIPRGRQGRTIMASAILAAVVPTAVLALTVPHALSFLNHQESRGIQFESVFGLPFLIGHWFGWKGTVSNTKYGSYEYDGTGVVGLGQIAIFVTALGFAAILFWRWKARHRASLEGGFTATMLADVALTATLVSMVTSRVLSPQYLVWVLGLAAVCLTRRDTLMRVPSLIILGTTSVTQLIFPLFYHSMRGGQVFSGLILVGRNAALVTATAMALIALFGWTKQEPASTPAPDDALSPERQSPERTSATSR